MMDPDYDLFAAVVDAQSLSAAARNLRLSPASVSKRLQRLEERLGARLIHRTTRRMVLTPQGKQLYQDLASVFGALKAAEERFTGLSGVPAGPLRMTAPTSFGRMYLAPCMTTFLAACPQVELELDLSDGFVDLIANPYDIAIRITAQVGAGLVAHRIATSRRVLCAAPGYLARNGVPETLGDLDDHALLAADGQLPWQLDGPAGTIRLAGRSKVRTNSSEIVRELALGGLGIALRSLWDVAPALERGELVRVLPEFEGSHDVGIYAVHAPLPQMPAATRAMIEHLETQFRFRAWE